MHHIYYKIKNIICLYKSDLPCLLVIANLYVIENNKSEIDQSKIKTAPITVISSCKFDTELYDHLKSLNALFDNTDIIGTFPVIQGIIANSVIAQLKKIMKR